ncbi:STAS domain-containing protein [Nonomuraea sp. NPDC050691]|uniref:STAS domain-containing protein n=1 Tax=Nonomuraea sp. NPDC050691 TaxID=3155661 RepID=UPI0033EF5D6E
MTGTSGPPPGLSVDRWLCGPITVLDLAGSLDAVDALRPYLVPPLAHRMPMIVVDLTRLETVAPEAFEMLADACRHADEAGGRMIVVTRPGTAPDTPDLILSSSMEGALEAFVIPGRGGRHRSRDRAAGGVQQGDGTAPPDPGGR